uniref:Uncharacterized protein n=1 Tax=Tetradesmus obliquus TaxID=3088 RepID=A0A383VI86_TETOB|eukprot:jgi/Sobl393_1/1536/SZX64911.1
MAKRSSARQQARKLEKLTKAAAQALGKQQQQKKKQQQQQQQQQRPAKQPHQRSNQSETGSVAEQEPALGGSAAAASQGRCQARSQKKTKKQLNVSNLRARLHMGVQRRSMKLRAAPGGATDVVVFVHFPLGLNGKLRTVFQGVTKQQAGAILGALIEMTGWDDERLEAKYQELVSGGEDSAEHDDQGQQLEQDASSDADSELCSETAEEEDADAEDEQQQQQQGRRLRRLQQTGSRRVAEHAEQQQQRADDAAALQELNEVVADACGGMRGAVTAVLTGAQADGCLAEITKGQVRTAVEERTGWDLDRETGSAPLRKLFSEVLEELHTQFWSQAT